MKNKVMLIFLAITIIINVSGCATLKVTKADANNPPDGIRVYPPRVYLMVDDEGAGTVLLAPDIKNGYDVKPVTFLAKQDFTMEMTGGQITKLTANQDSTAVAIALINSVGSTIQEAIKAAGKGVALETITIRGVKPGIYMMQDDGTFIRLNLPEPEKPSGVAMGSKPSKPSDKK